MDMEQRRREYVRQLEQVVKQMLSPLRGVPFNLAIEAMTGFKVLEFRAGAGEHRRMLDALIEGARCAAREINRSGIRSARANEVGNRIEEFVKDGLNSLPGVKADTPKTRSGAHKASGYPDIEAEVDGVVCYVECKTFNAKNLATTQRSFYFSPSEDFKVTLDAVHFVLSYEMYSESSGIFKTSGFKVLSLDSLSLDVKHEFNSDNRRLYSGRDGTLVLHEEKIV